MENNNQNQSITEKVIIRVYSGKTVESNCRQQLHPINEVKAAEKLISLNKSLETYSNSPDFISAIKWICEARKIECEFYLDGISQGKNIEPLFESFNEAFDLLDELVK